jgi:hypothetical protein
MSAKAHKAAIFDLRYLRGEFAASGDCALPLIAEAVAQSSRQARIAAQAGGF